MAIKKETLTNGLLLLFSLIVSAAIGYYAYRHLVKPPEHVVYRGAADDYSLSFYNQQGQKISPLNGTLKLMLDPFLIYRNYPHQKSGSYSIDAEGFREGHTDDKPETAIVLGGSAAFGQGLDDDGKTFSSRLSRTNSRYNVINAATVGYLSGQELSQMVHYLDDLKPSLYIAFDGWNDIFDPFAFIADWPTSRGPVGFNNTFFMIEDRLAAFLPASADKDEANRPAPEPIGSPMDESEYFQRVLRAYLSNIEKMHAFAEARGAGFLLVLQPELSNKTQKSAQELATLKIWNDTYGYLDKGIPEKYRRLTEEAKRLCAAIKIDCLDINDQPAFANNAQTLFYDVVHPNEAGHEIIADIINKALAEKSHSNH